ncbi:hypothetical protein TNIN_82211 [Trichonephila inaurata madagascariensis]|uniref:Uncharacterized protein n=1 Tax=Trichonephila inaurata madagascariensis TaxID=2747483 RepID=A0A8X6XM23_9ARAC|nr:hypothetical protein TNIN_82211 [Trichonephila inaurata madagascariensis]
MTELGESKKDYLYYFAFRLSIANTLIHGSLKKLSPTPSLAEDENNEPPPKRLAFHIKQLIPMKLGTCLKMVRDGNHRSRCRNEKCLALQLYNVQTARVFCALQVAMAFLYSRQSPLLEIDVDRHVEHDSAKFASSINDGFPL